MWETYAAHTPSNTQFVYNTASSAWIDASGFDSSKRVRLELRLVAFNDRRGRQGLITRDVRTGARRVGRKFDIYAW